MNIRYPIYEGVYRILTSNVLNWIVVIISLLFFNLNAKIRIFL